MTTASGATEFALAVYAHLRERHGNVVFSPFSLRMALRVALLGARAETAAEMRTALHVTPAEESPDTPD